MKLNCVIGAGIFAAVLGGWSGAASAESITAALASAYTNNPDILAATLGAQVAAEGIVRAKSAAMPNLYGSLGVNDSYNVTSPTSPGVPTNSLSSSISLNYTQNIFDGGVVNAQVEAARANAEAQLESVRSTEQNVLFNAALAYVSVVRDSKIAALRADSVKFLQAQLQAAKDRLNVGEGTQTDVVQAQASYAQSLADQQTAISNLAVSQANYVRYVGHQPSGLTLTFPYEKMLPATLDQAFALADQNHPAIRGALAQVRAAKANADAAKGAFGPSLSVQGAMSSTSYLTSGSASVGASVGLSLRVPLYQGGALGSAERQTNLQQIQSEVSSQSTRDLIRAQIAQSWSSIKSAATLIAAVQSAEDAAKQVLNSVGEEFKVGQKTTLDVLNAQSSLTSVQISKATAEANRVSAAFSLLSSLGRLSAKELGLAVELRKPEAYRAKVEDIWQELRAVPN